MAKWLGGGGSPAASPALWPVGTEPGGGRQRAEVTVTWIPAAPGRQPSLWPVKRARRSLLSAASRLQWRM